jgi:hypothetical protein
MLAADYAIRGQLLDVWNLTLYTIVAVFWLLVIRKAIAAGRAWFPNLVILPVFFAAVGVLLNARKPGLGAAAVGGLHVLLLLMLALRLARRRPPGS